MSRPTRRRPTPVDREQHFTLDELFISTTDLKGHIRLCNRVFARVSGYPPEDLLGQAHNVVRHPDMPRSVFKLFWQRLTEGKPVAAYVKNISADGSYYWVMAAAVPVPGGYISVRLKPSTELLGTAETFYKEVRAIEREIEADDTGKRKDAIAASEVRLGELLAQAGYSDYERFMHAALPAEVASRETLLAEAGTTVHVDRPAGADPHLLAVLDACAAAHSSLGGLVGDLARYDGLEQRLAGKSGFVLGLADSVRLFSLNALLASARLADGAALGAVADLLGTRSQAAGIVIRDLSEKISDAASLLGGMGYQIAAAKLQTEMMVTFVGELLEQGAVGRDGVEQLTMLVDSARDAVGHVCDSLPDLERRLSGVAHRAEDLERDLRVVQALEVSGRVEAARIADGRLVEGLFEAIGEHMRDASAGLEDFAEVGQLAMQRNPESEARARADLDRMARRVEELREKIEAEAPTAAAPPPPVAAETLVQDDDAFEDAELAEAQAA